ncbi:MAG: domain S-box protein, partial [Verrucomicrobiales bacterium]|nr:domain S-box protein [Verrucomicrobiales bacterium]
ELNRLNNELAGQAAHLKQLNQTLLDSEQRLRLAIETGRIGLFVWDSTQVTNPGDWSSQLKEIFGLPLDAEVTHDMFLKCVHPDDREHIDQCVQRALKGENGGEYHTEYRTIKPGDGSEHWVTARGQAFFNQQGQAFRFIGTVMDITERKLAEQSLNRSNSELEQRVSQRVAELARANEALQKEISERKRAEVQLQQSQAYLAEAQKLSLTGSFGWNVSTGDLFWSAETFCILGCERTVQPTLELAFNRVHPEDIAAVKATLDHAVFNETDLDFEHRILLTDGTIKEVHVVARRSNSESSHLAYIGAIMDVTARKRNENALRASEHLARGQLTALTKTLDALALETEPDKFLEHLLRTIAMQLGAHSCGVWRVQENSNLLAFAFAFENSNLIMKSDSVLGPVSPSLRIEDVWPWPEVFRTRRAYVLEDIREGPSFPWRDHVLALGVVTILVVPMLIAGRVEGVIGIRFTERRKFRSEEIELAQALANQAMLALQLTQLAAQSRQSAVMAERNRLARDIHDTLAQGFTGVIVQLEAARGAAARNDHKEIAKRIEQADDLARSSLGEARRSVRALRPRSLRDGTLCAALQDLLKRMSNGTDLNAEFHVQGEQRIVPSDWEESLLRIAQESLTNTIKHARARNFRTNLTIAADKVELQLTDDGRGFDAQAEYDGLGLVGMKERVDQMGGEFILRSKPGQGTELLVIFKNPARSKPDASNEQKQEK